MKKQKSFGSKPRQFGTALNKALTQFCTIISAVTITYWVMTFYGLMEFEYSLAIFAGVAALIATFTISGINRYKISKRIGWKLFYAIPLAGIALLFLISLEATLPFKWLGFIVFIIMVGIPADMFINNKSKNFFKAFKSLSRWDVITDLAISCIAGYVVSSNWDNPIIVVPTLLGAYAIIVLWNFSINSKGPKGPKSNTTNNTNNANNANNAG